jgi:hypothetical protein
MNALRQPFRFSKKLWVVATCAVFFYLFFTVRIGLPGKFPVNFTAWKAFLDGEIGMGGFFSFGWVILALGVGALIAAILGIVGQLLFRSRDP